MQGKDATVVEETSPPMITKEEYADLVCMLRSSKKTNNHHKEVVLTLNYIVFLYVILVYTLFTMERGLSPLF